MKKEVNNKEISKIESSKEASKDSTTDVETSITKSKEVVETHEKKEENSPTLELPTKENEEKKSGINLIVKIMAFGIVPVIAIAAVIVLLVGGVTIKVATGTPKAVFKNSINALYKEVNNAMKDYDKTYDKWDLKENAFQFEGNMNATFQDGDEKQNFKLDFETGIHAKKDQALVGATMSMDGDTMDARFLIEDDKLYLSSSLLEEPIDVTDVASSVFGMEPEEVTMLMETLSTASTNKVNKKDVEYITKTIKNAFIKTLDSKQMTKKSAKYEVDGKSVSATKISYEIDEATLKNTIRTMCEELLEDDEFLDKLAGLVADSPIMELPSIMNDSINDSEESEISKSDIKSALKDGLKEAKSSASDIELDEEIIINIYIKGLTNKVVGFSIEVDDKEYISYYTNGKNAEFIMDNHVKDDGYYSSKFKLVITLTDGKKEQNLLVKYNGEKIAEATIRSLTEEKIDADFKVGMDEETVKGTIYFTLKEKKQEISGEYNVSISFEETKVSAEGTYSFKAVSSLDSFANDAIDIEDVDYDAIRGNIDKKIEDSSLSDDLNDLVNDIEKKALNVNSYGMREVTEKEAINLLKNKKVTVLYVGDTYYSSYSNREAYNLFYNLRSAQNKYGFYSNYLDDYDATDEFYEAVGDVTYTCQLDSEKENNEEAKPEQNKPTEEPSTETVNTCKQVPVIYLIKDGKVVKGLRVGITEEEFIKELQAVGIK